MEEGEAVVVTTLLLVVSPALFHTVFSVVVSVAEALVAEAPHVFSAWWSPATVFV